MAPGRFIALEGIDGSGTTSQAAALGARLEQRGHTVWRTHEPSNGSIGRLVRARLARDAEPLDPAAMALLFAADRIDHVRTEIEPVVARGDIVLTDRYLVSSWVYQALQCDPTWVRTINDRAPWPDLTFIITLPVEVALSRVHQRQRDSATEIYEDEPLQRRVAAGYEAVLEEKLDGVIGIDGDRPPQEITEELLEHCINAGL